MSPSRGIPEQDKPENQDPAVRNTLDQMTGEVTEWDEDKKKKSDSQSDKDETVDKPAAAKRAASK